MLDSVYVIGCICQGGVAHKGNIHNTSPSSHCHCMLVYFKAISDCNQALIYKKSTCSVNNWHFSAVYALMSPHLI